jgi:anti-sigma factor ChrR (cupin superfamily)
MRHTQAEGATCELAALYALGALEGTEARSFEQHLDEGCAACAAEVEAFAETCAALALAAPAAAPPASARERLLARVSEESGGPPPETSGRPAPRSEARADSPAADASGLLVVRAGEGEWLKTEDPGVFVKLLYVDRERETVTTLVRMSPGSRIPPHRHRGAEQCLVLEGDVSSGVHTLSAGDFNCAPAGSVHDELTSERGALLLIVSPGSYEVLAPRAG